jgi:hypothetical protein
MMRIDDHNEYDPPVSPTTLGVPVWMRWRRLADVRATRLADQGFAEDWYAARDGALVEMAMIYERNRILEILELRSLGLEGTELFYEIHGLK